MNIRPLSSELLSEALQLSEEGQAYAWATVVRTTPPSSAYVGAQAIVTADGILHGWVGGGCARDIVIQSCLDAIRTRSSKLIRISNEAAAIDPDTELHAMPCASNGALDLFIQAANPAPTLCIAGDTPAAKAAGEFAAVLGWRVFHSHAETGAPHPDYILVATQGDDDAGQLEQALKSSAKKVFLIASARKAASLRSSMQYLGISDARLADLESPAGPSIHADTPAEVALAAIAGLVRAHRSASGLQPARPASAQPDPALQDSVRQETQPAYINPVCLRPIDPATALHVITVNGETHYFCCNGCKHKFDADPDTYLEIARTASGARPRA